jgi:hypothetical protein
MSAENKRKEKENKRRREEEKKILSEVFNLDFHEFVDEYTDEGPGKALGKTPDFYLRSKEEGLPDLAIEVKTLRRDHDRPADYDKPLEVKEHYLSVKDFQFVLKLDLPVHKNPDPIKVKKIWHSLKEELDKYEEKWEYILDRISDIENILENEDKDIYVKDLPHEKKDELRKIIDDIKRQDERFVKSLPNDILFAYTCLATYPEICQIKIKDVEGKIKESKEKGLSSRVADFIWYHFMDELKDFPKNYVMKVKKEGVKDNSIFIATRFTITMEPEDPVFHIKEVERYVERSKGKFENLRKVKSDKSDDSPHWELLLVKGLLVAYYRFNSLIEEIEEWLKKNGYDYLLGVRDSGGIYYLIIRMDKGVGVSGGGDWKTQIGRIIKH